MVGNEKGNIYVKMIISIKKGDFPKFLSIVSKLNKVNKQFVLFPHTLNLGHGHVLMQDQRISIRVKILKRKYFFLFKPK